MMHRARLIASLSLVALVCGALTFLAIPRPAQASGGLEDDAKVLIKLDEEWSKAASKKDLESVISLYAEDGNAYPPNEPAAKGRAAVRKVWSTYLSDPSFNVSWKTTKAEVSGDLGYTLATYEVSFNLPDGKPGKEVGKCLCVWKKQKDGSWKALHDMWNADAK
jgi:ketosteroid isomerase-like protein